MTSNRYGHSPYNNNSGGEKVAGIAEDRWESGSKTTNEFHSPSHKRIVHDVFYN